MKRFIIIITIILLYPFDFVSAWQDKDKSTGVVSHVFDGDTIKVNNGKKHITIRLYGIDTPELDQPFASDAKKAVQSMLLNQTISYLPLYYDDYNRLIAHVYLGDKNINQTLVENGLAWVHIYYCYQAICNEWKRLQHQAKIKESGLWLESDPVAPWVWKRKKK